MGKLNPINLKKRELLSLGEFFLMMIKIWSSQELGKKDCVYLNLYSNMQHKIGWTYLVTRYEDKH